MKSAKSRSLRRVRVRIPSGISKIFFKKRKPSKAKCGVCGAVLKGVAKERPFKMRKMAKSKKRPERPYGGVLCSKCMRKLIIRKVRAEKK